MRLTEYIESIGPDEFARRHGFTRRATDAYRYGARRPKPDDPRTLKLIAESPVTWEGIYWPDTAMEAAR